ncbi:hypothetical protein [Roseococcus pinisoli]|uniref:Uncharacterized protein n=1 Tax=Roseococcus pinisoli TaxID=2835040 RepID=A0ABS5QG41_9PROT|nr:hypothetical protein [Roseococcus pinisoli]MBS7812348.1 hypothetical protein [Roseococcus pinisoli]
MPHTKIRPAFTFHVEVPEHEFRAAADRAIGTLRALLSSGFGSMNPEVTGDTTACVLVSAGHESEATLTARDV